MKCWIVLFIPLPVYVSEKSRKVWTSLPGKFTMEDNDTSSVGVWLNRWFMLQRSEKRLLDEFLRVEIQGSLDVSCLVFVRVSTINDLIIADRVRKLSPNETSEGVSGNGFKILVLSDRKRQDTGLAEITGEIQVRGASVDRGLDMCVCFRFRKTPLETRLLRTRGIRNILVASRLPAFFD